MGNETSQVQPNEEVNPQFEESYFHSYLTFTREEMGEEQEIFNLPKEALINLLLFSPEHIEDKRRIIQYILNSPTKEIIDTSYLNPYYEMYYKSKELTNTRIKTDTAPKIKMEPGNESSILIDVITTLFSSVFSIDYDIIPAKNALDIIKSIPNTPKMLPPYLDFKLQGPHYSGLLTQQQVYPKGITSNGSFLFILHPDSNLTVFPLLDNGALLDPFTVTLNLIPSTYPSLFATKDQVIVKSFTNHYQFSIKRILERPKSTVRGKELQNFNQNVIATDGAVYVSLSPDKTVRVFDIQTNKLINEVLLVQGNAPLHPERPDLLDDNFIFKSIVETNGSFLSFYVTLDNNQVLCRQFSLINGNHTGDIVFEQENNIMALNLNIIHKMHYSVKNTGSQLVVESFKYEGVDDPFIFGLKVPIIMDLSGLDQQLLFYVNLILLSSIGPQIPAELKLKNVDEYIILLSNIMNLMGQDSKNPKVLITLQTFILIASLHSEMFLNSQKINKTLESILINLPKKINDEITLSLVSLLFTKCFDRFMTNNILNTIISAVDVAKGALFDRLISDISRSKFLCFLSMTENNVISLQLLKSDNHDISSSNLMRFFYLQQRVLVREVARELENDTFSSLKIFQSKTKSVTVLDFFGEYSSVIINSFINSLNNFIAFEDLQKSSIFKLVSNFLSLLSGISDYHSISQIILPLLSMLTISLSNFFKTYQIDIMGPAKEFLLLISFLFGLFSSTLVRGGDVSDFEERNIFLIVENSYLMDDEQTLISYLNFDKNSNKNSKMNEIYKFWKPQINKKLRDDAKEIDSFCLTVFVKHIKGAVEEMEKSIEKQKVSDPFRVVLENIFKIRNFFMQQKRENQSLDEFDQKLSLLINLKSDFSDKSNIEDCCKSITDFLISKDPAKSLIYFITNQKIRVTLTSIGFALLQDIFSKNLDNLFYTTIAIVLSKIEDFDNLSKILSHSKKSISFLISFIKSAMEMKYVMPIMPLIIKLFKSKVIPDEEIGKITTSQFLAVLNSETILEQEIAVVYDFINLIPQSLAVLTEKLTHNPLNSHLSLFSIYIEKSYNCPTDLYDKFLDFVLNCDDSQSMIARKCLFNATKFAKIENDKFKSDLMRIITFIGENLLNSKNLIKCSELVNFLRQILKDSGEKSTILRKIIMSTTLKTNIKQIATVLAILGGSIETIRPFNQCQMKTDASTSQDIIIYSNDTFINLPINETAKIEDLPKSDVLAVSEVPFDILDYPDFDFILDFSNLVIKSENSVLTVIYLNCLSKFAENEDFCKSLSNRISLTKFISKYISTFDNMDVFIEKYSKLSKYRPLNTFRGFEILMKKNQCTYLSKPLSKTAKVKLLIESEDNFVGCIGIIDSHDYKCKTNNLILLPQYITAPIDRGVEQKMPAKYIIVEVDFSQKTFTVNGSFVPWISDATKFHRIIVYPTKQSKIISMNLMADDSCYAKTFPINTDVVGISDLDDNKRRKLFSMPAHVQQNRKELKESLEARTITRFSNLITTKYEEIGINPPPLGCIDPKEADEMTENLRNLMNEQILFELRCQISSIVLTKMISYVGDEAILVEASIRLFSILLCQLEQFSLNLLHEIKFPFDLNITVLTPNIPSNLLMQDMTEYGLSCIRKISSSRDFFPNIQKYIERLVGEPKTHLLTDTKKDVDLLIPAFKDDTFFVPHGSNYYVGYSIFNKDPSFGLDSVYVYTPCVASEDSLIQVPATSLTNPMFMLKIDPNTTSWIFGTDFEILLLLRTLFLIGFNKYNPLFIRSKIIELTVVNSPMTSRHVPELLNTLCNNIIKSDNYTTEYMKLLYLLISFVNTLETNHKNFDAILTFTDQEVMKMAESNSELSQYFPEFGLTNEPVKGDKTVTITNLPNFKLDGNKAQMRHLFNVMTTVAVRTDTIDGFPFFVLIPYWFALDYLLGNSKTTEIIVDKISPASVSIYCTCKLELSFKQRTQEDNAILIVDQSNDSQLFRQYNFPMIIEVREKITVVILSDDDNRILKIDDLVYKEIKEDVKLNQRPIPKKIDFVPDQIRNEFVNDMKLLRTKWNASETINLLQSFPEDLLSAKDFFEIAKLAFETSLMKIYPPKVVLLQSFMIHVINYVYLNNNDVTLQRNIIHYISPSKQAQVFLNEIKISESSPDFTINRRKARQVVLSNSGDCRNTIIHQFSEFVDTHSTSSLRGRGRPWRVHFTDESAIDAGGPSREAFNEIAISIFQSQSKLFILSPNGRNHSGGMRDVYIPFSSLRPFTSRSLFYAVGVFIGIVIRNGYFQDFPFAPFVWKYLANEPLDKNDILCLDEHFANMANSLVTINEHDFNKTYANMKWAVTDWDDSTNWLKSKDQIVGYNDIKNYLNMCVGARINSVKANLENMKRGFYDNLGFSNPSIFNSNLISYLAQGSRTVTTQAFKSITSMLAPTNQQERYFWEAVDRMTNEQRSLLLKFATTMTRIPNPAINLGFKLFVNFEAQLSDSSLPKASTCFNRLYLPLYSSSEVMYNKLVTAIEFCDTMENS
ncbi:hypothetical protein TVAG_039950 [Trichomonas vaginalis G3]|uniref:HECT domain-containing protein n=1 Tax=Trichomonas vaginalis (strain ATCC PRA-98 / G3) TaxID=412133 RepID=A2EQW9_TRIV3|nr:guanyl-nucleotide exchange factor protein [Trichomonas vaginalis G3]EAY04943.1 hypothetical protein TVAG_039950 [Trichomonas vaginalis G3]KAI5508773.1 guanyl-nucleotide exchange factor protein [Trichomonas vaginalis G3]|eukprot:XP_001317166.1 hypothetical protein [Trichomonas vaginalis G3]